MLKRIIANACKQPPYRLPHIITKSLIACALLLALSACDKKQDGSTNNAVANKTAGGAQPLSAVDAGQIVERYRALDSSSNSVMKMRATITSMGETSVSTPPRVNMIVYRKREPDGSRFMLVEFTAPAQERDRDSLIIISPDSEIEGIRYAQSNDSFIGTKDPMSEESLFGMTMQEFADGQTEKYDFKLVGEEMLNSSPVYRVEGRLKQGAESKFPRLVLLISKENSVVLAAEFYDNKDNLARSVTVSRVEQVGGHWTRMRWAVDNRARQRKIDFEVVEAKYDQKLSDSIFTREHLKKIASKRQ